MTSQRFEIQTPDSYERLKLEFEGLPESRSTDQINATESWLDTFEWSLFKAGYRLTYTTGLLSLFSNKTGRILRTDRVNARPKFLWHLNEGPIKKKVAPIVEIRALLEILKSTEEVHRWNVIDENQKTVVRIELRRSEVVAGPGNKVYSAFVFPVRGYKDAATNIEGLLVRNGLKPADRTHSEALLASADVVPSDYTSKINIRLDPAEPAEAAVRKILGSLLDTMLANEAGVRRNLDSEFLHDFRVTVRRARSLLAQLKKVFPKPETSKLRKELSFLGRSTNRARDLDVYLLHMPEFMRIVPASMRGKLNVLRTFLESERQTAYTKLNRLLGGKRYRELVGFWRGFLEPRPGQQESAPKAAVPIISLARQTIHKRAENVRSMGEAITDSSHDEDLHQLRIECKKFRYLLEFFASLFPEKKIKELVRHMKQLQDNLGSFQDQTVQQRMLRGFLDEMKSAGTATTDLTLAIGFLIGHLEQAQESTRKSFYSAFETFNGPSNQKMMADLFETRERSAQ